MHRAALIVTLLCTGCGPLPDRSPHLAVSPERINLQALATGGAQTVPLVLLNVGEAPLQVQRFRLGVSTGYAVAAPPLPLQLGPGEEVTAQIQYRAGPGAPLSNVLEIDCGVEPSPRVELSALPPSPQLILQPSALEFGAVPSGGSLTRVVNVYNAGLSPAYGLGLEWADPSPDFSARLLAASAIPAGGRADLLVTYAPRSGDEDRGTLVVRWDSGGERLRLSGRQDLSPPD